MPVVMSFVVVGILWTWIYNGEFGLVNNLLRAVGLGGLARDWLGDTKIARWSLIAVDIWKWYGFHMVIHGAGCRRSPPNITTRRASMAQHAGVSLPASPSRCFNR